MCFNVTKMSKMICIRLLDYAEPAAPLMRAVIDLNSGAQNNCLIEMEPESFKALPGAPFSYWVTAKGRAAFKDRPSFADQGALVKVGMQTGDDGRFVRCWWEVSFASKQLSESYWASFAKGGEFSPYFCDIHLVVNYKSDGREMLSTDAARIQNSQFYFKKGLTYPRRLHKFSPAVLPANTVISVRGSGVYAEQSNLLDVLALCSSSAFDYLLKAMLGRAEHPQFDNGVIMQVPVPNFTSVGLESIRNDLVDVIRAQRDRLSLLETNVFFHHPSLAPMRDDYLENEDQVVKAQAEKTLEMITSLEQKINDIVDSAYGFQSADRGSSSIVRKGKRTAKEYPGLAIIAPAAKRLASYVFGCAIGRYNPQLSGRPNDLLSDSDVFKPSPTFCPAMQGGVPKCFIIDDASSQPLGSELTQVLRTIFPESFNQCEAKLAAALGGTSLLDYFRKPAGFFVDHLDTFSKSQRLAPIYWPLSTISGGYTIWVYYPELDDQSLPKLIADVLSPKIRILTQEIENRRVTPGAKFSELEALRQELEEMRAGFLDLINRGYRPNQNDGVLITACPLAKYFRHAGFRRELEACWKALSCGDYDWSHLAMAMWPDRVLEASKKDRSIAIAHGREDLCPAEPPKAVRGRKKTHPPA
jgi:hypothetical protein